MLSKPKFWRRIKLDLQKINILRLLHYKSTQGLEKSHLWFPRKSIKGHTIMGLRNSAYRLTILA